MSEPSTVMSISGPGFQVFNDYSTRALTMTIEPIAAAQQLFRTINGDLEDASLLQFQNKFNVTISCSDMESPNFVGLFPGAQVTVTAIHHLGVRRDDDSAGAQTYAMRVVSWSVSTAEWPHQTSWTLNLVM